MKRFFPFAIAALSLVACEDDDLADAGGADVLNLDGPNVTGPVLDEGSHRFAVQFDPQDIEPFEGRSLDAVRVYVGEAPASMRLSVHEGGETVPGRELTAVNVSSFGEVRRFVDYRLGDAVPLTSDDFLWIVAEVELPGTQRSIGCDAGPATDGGDWLWSGDRYLTFEARTGESVNWNIRGLVE